MINEEPRLKKMADMLDTIKDFLKNVFPKREIRFAFDLNEQVLICELSGINGLHESADITSEIKFNLENGYKNLSDKGVKMSGINLNVNDALNGSANSVLTIYIDIGEFK